LTLGSLFDGIGGFPLAATLNGITPLWASEIEAAPISITKKHFPDMKHLGDITQIKGNEIESVDIITFGSPCQDLSIAGKRSGLDGERSGLFMETVRIIKEMRNETNGANPRFIVWENVPGAFSSNNREDFRVVIEEIAKIAGDVSIPRPPARDTGTDAIWESAGAVMGDGFSLAWRIMDAQYWGVPQRRRRIFLIADFAGGSAGEILFKCDSLSGNTAESGEEREGIARDTKNSVKAAEFNGYRSITGSIEYKEECSLCIQTKMSPNAVIGFDGYNQILTGDITKTLRGSRLDADNLPIICLENHPGDSRITINDDSKVNTLTSRMGTGGGNVPLIMADKVYGMAPRQQAQSICEDKSPSILSTDYKEPNCVFCIQGNIIDRSDNTGANGEGVNKDVSFTLNTTDRHVIAYTPSGFGKYTEGIGTLKASGGDLGGGSETLLSFAMQGYGEYKEADKASTIKSRDHKDSTDLIKDGYAVRRLTPLECERLQGFPDGWTEYGNDNKPISDSTRYKALGNSVAVPCVNFILGRISEYMRKDNL